MMKALRNLFGGREKTPSLMPPWAKVLVSADDYGEFIRIAKSSIRSVHPRAKIVPDEGYWIPEAGSSQMFGLTNLLQMCAGQPRSEWDQIVTGFVTELTGLALSHETPPFEEVRPQLRIRLFPADSVLPDTLVTAPVSECFVTVLARDLPRSVATVNKDGLESWGKSASELFDLALENTWQFERVEPTPMKISERVTILSGEGQSFFTCSNALLLDRFDLDLGEEGALVAIPNRHAFFVHPAKGGAEALAFLAGLARHCFEQGPGSVTPDVLWWRRGQFETVRLEIKGAEANFLGPDDLVPILSARPIGF